MITKQSNFKEINYSFCIDPIKSKELQGILSNKIKNLEKSIANLKVKFSIQERKKPFSTRIKTYYESNSQIFLTKHKEQFPQSQKLSNCSYNNKYNHKTQQKYSKILNSKININCNKKEYSYKLQQLNLKKLKYVNRFEQKVENDIYFFDFSKFTTFSKVGNSLRTFKNLKELCLDFGGKYEEINDKQFVSLLQQIAKIKTLEALKFLFGDKSYLSKNGFSYFPRTVSFLKYLKSLAIFASSQNEQLFNFDQSLHHFSLALNKIKQLEKLQWKFEINESKYAYNLFSNLGKGKCIRELDISIYLKVGGTPVKVDELAFQIRKLKNLEKFNFRFGGNYFCNAQLLFQALSQLPILREVSLLCPFLPEKDDSNPIIYWLSILKQVNTIHLVIIHFRFNSNLQFCDTPAHILLQLNQLQNLNFSLCQCQTSEEGFLILFLNLRQCKNLKRLSLNSSNGRSEFSAKNLLQLMKTTIHLTKLIEFKLSISNEVRITDEHFEILSENVPQIKKLQHLFITLQSHQSKIQVSKQGFSKFSQCLESCSKLKKLDLTITDTKLVDVKSLFDTLQIEKKIYIT